MAKTLEDRRRGSPSGEEELRFIRNFHDIFLSIGLLMFAVGVGFVSTLILKEVVGDNPQDWRSALRLAGGIALADAAIMWLLAEFFARTRRLFLPAIVILLTYIWFVGVGTFALYVAQYGSQEFDNPGDAIEQLKLLPLVLTGAVTLAIYLFYFRSKLPFAMGLGALSLAGVGVSAFIYHHPETALENATLLQFGSGLFMFVLGVFFDARDPERRTRLSDNGFWLHFFAAPLIFASVLNYATGGGMFARELHEAAGGPANNETMTAAVTLIVVTAFAIISLLINRRALLVAGLISAAVAIGVLVSKTGLDGAWTAALTLLLLGGAMVLLGGGWHGVRRALVAPFPKTGLIARIIPPEPRKGEAAEAEDN